MYTRVLSELGIDFSEEELLLHRFIALDFFLPPTAENVQKARKWLVRLISYNHEHKIYPPHAFEKICEQKWNALFYHLPEYGKEVAHAFIRQSPNFSFSQRYYFFRYRMKQYVGI